MSDTAGNTSNRGDSRDAAPDEHPLSGLVQLTTVLKFLALEAVLVATAYATVTIWDGQMANVVFGMLISIAGLFFLLALLVLITAFFQ